MRKITLGFAAIAIAFSALTFGANSASALDFSITFGTAQPPIVRYHEPHRGLPVTPHTHRPVVPHRHTAPPLHYDHRSDWRDRSRHDRRWQDDRRGDRRWHDDRRRSSQSCTARTERFWDGRAWVTERHRICR